MINLERGKMNSDFAADKNPFEILRHIGDYAFVPEWKKGFLFTLTGMSGNGKSDMLPLLDLKFAKSFGPALYNNKKFFRSKEARLYPADLTAQIARVKAEYRYDRRKSQCELEKLTTQARREILHRKQEVLQDPNNIFLINGSYLDAVAYHIAIFYLNEGLPVVASQLSQERGLQALLESMRSSFLIPDLTVFLHADVSTVNNRLTLQPGHENVTSDPNFSSALSNAYSIIINQYSPEHIIIESDNLESATETVYNEVVKRLKL